MRGKFSLTEIWNCLAREMEEGVLVTYNVHETSWHKCGVRETFLRVGSPDSQVFAGHR